jgi:hypothetical protein
VLSIIKHVGSLVIPASQFFCITVLMMNMKIHDKQEEAIVYYDLFILWAVKIVGFMYFCLTLLKQVMDLS